jgi:hypothetical protein
MGGEPRTIDIAEFEALRQEINSRLNVSYSLLALELAALGAGISVADKFPQALSGLAIVSSLLWLYWTDNSVQIQRIGAYIALDLAPRINEREDREVLRWEAFMRRLIRGGQDAAALLFGDSPPAGRVIPAAFGTDWFTAALFGGSPPLLILLYAFGDSHDSAGAWLLLASATVVTMPLWGYGAVCLARFNHLKHSVARAILLRDTSSQA